MIFVDTGFFFALFAAEEKQRHLQAHELLETLAGRKLSDVLITTDQVVRSSRCHPRQRASSRRGRPLNRPPMRTVELDDELASLLEREKPLEQVARESIVMDLYRREKSSIGKACERLGLARLDFMRRAGELGIPVYLTTEEEWRRDKATVDAWHSRSRLELSHPSRSHRPARPPGAALW